VIFSASCRQTGSQRAARFFFALVTWAGAAAALAQVAQPEAASGYLPRPASSSQAFMVVTANSLAEMPWMLQSLRSGY
jgi:hypothetical protein